LSTDPTARRPAQAIKLGIDVTMKTTWNKMRITIFLTGWLVLLSTVLQAQAPTIPFAGSNLRMVNGSSQHIFNSWAPQFWELAQGTSAAPITGAGALFKVSRTESVAASTCGNNHVDNECNAAAAFYNIGTSSDEMQTNAVIAGAQSGSRSDNVGLTSIGRTTGSGTGIGTGAYLEGRRDTATGNNLGAEVRSTNQTASSESYFSGGYNSGSLWVTAGGNAQSACGACVGNAGQSFDVAFGATASSAVSQTFRDDSSSVTSLQINGSHTNGIDLTGGTFGGSPILAPLARPASSSATCKQGSIEWDASFIYVCTATNTWKRAALSAF
jgi:hypothetical protein